MDKFYAICPFCGRSIFVENDSEQQNNCSACGHVLDAYKQLKEKNCIIDADAADTEYLCAQQHFANNNFAEAEAHYKKVLDYNRNHYLANYYVYLCDIYENEDNENYNLPQALIKALLTSIHKLDLCQSSLQIKFDFLYNTLHQVYIMLSTCFNRICERYEKREQWDLSRNRSLQLVFAVKELINLDKEKLLVYDVSIAKVLVSITDLAICACRKVIQPHISNMILDLPTDYQCENAKNLCGILTYYATSLDTDYVNASIDTDYTENLLWNEKIHSKLNRYNAENKSAHKKYLSTPGSVLDNFLKEAPIAVRYSYHTCFNELRIAENAQARIALMNDAIVFCLELLKPRISVNTDKKFVVLVKNLVSATQTGQYLNAFLNAFARTHNKLATEYVNRFFKELFETIKLHYNTVYLNYNKYVDKLKEYRNAAYDYYKNFLHQMIYASMLASKEVIALATASVSERLKILRLGKQITEEFLLLNDYNIADLELSPLYSDVLDIFNALDNNISEFSVQK